MSRINRSLTMEWDLGFRTIGCPNEDFRNIQCYGESLSQNSHQALGFMDTDWDGTAAVLSNCVDLVILLVCELCVCLPLNQPISESRSLASGLTSLVLIA